MHGHAEAQRCDAGDSPETTVPIPDGERHPRGALRMCDRMLPCSGIMGRPRQSPSIKKLVRPGGRVVWRVLATIRGKQRKRICRSYSEALLLKGAWGTEQHTEIPHLATRLAPRELIEAEAMGLTLTELGLTFREAERWLQKFYRPPSKIEWDTAISKYHEQRIANGVSEAQVSNVRKAACRFAGFVRRSVVGNVTRAEVEAFLTATLPSETTAETFNGLLGDTRTFFRWAVNEEIISEDPTARIQRRKVKRKIPATLLPERVESLFQDIVIACPGWIPYAAVCVFGAVRPSTREGEAFRLDQNLRNSVEVIRPGGIDVIGKVYGPRLVPWSVCGPLKEWLEAYPPSPGLWPSSSGTQAERAWAKIRKKHNLSEDVLRHTAISAMLHAPGASYASVAYAAGNSETMIRRHYEGRWSPELTQQLWAIRPSNFARPNE
jgi:integrase